MFATIWNQIKKMDLYLLGVSSLLIMIGLLMIYSTTFSLSTQSELLPRQLIALALGFGILLALSSINYRQLKAVSVLGYLLSISLLGAVLFLGRVVKGSTRWFDLGITNFQPVELAKFFLILALAVFFQKNLNRITEFRYFLLSLLIAVIPIGLTLIQPDLGSALVLGFVWLALALSAGAKRSHIAFLLLMVVIAGVVAWSFYLQDYQKSRIESFLDPTRDPRGRGYNAIQAVTAVGSGGLLGRGFARGVVSQLRFLPERQTDFIFASLAEELGLLGAFLLLGLFLTWYMRMIRIVRESTDNFGYFLALGICSYLFFQSTVNIGMNIGLLPITGIPLPLVSYGGSSLVVTMAALGVLQSVHIRSQANRFI